MAQAAKKFQRPATQAPSLQNQARNQRRLYGRKWSTYRRSFLTRPENRWCVECVKEGKLLVPATVVDHITPYRGDPVLFWDESNHQGLCVTHHNAKSAREGGGRTAEQK